MTAEKPGITLSHPGKLRQFASIARRTKNHSLGKLSQQAWWRDSIFRGLQKQHIVTQKGRLVHRLCLYICKKNLQ